MPDIFGLDAASMRARVPAPADRSAISPFSASAPSALEAFKHRRWRRGCRSSGADLPADDLAPLHCGGKGVVTLGSLLRDLPEATTRRLLVAEKDNLLIRVPNIVLPGATLLMAGAEFNQYRLGAQSGAFIAVADA